MEVRPLVSCSSRALLKYQSGSTSTLRNTLIHPSRFARPSSTRYLSTTSPASAPGTGVAPTAPPAQETRQQQQRARRHTGLDTDKLNDVSDLLNNLGLPDQHAGRRPNRFGAVDQMYGDEVSDMLGRTPTRRQGMLDDGGLPALRGLAQSRIEAAKEGPEMRLSPSLGRTIQVRNGELNGALAMLNARLKKNQVASDKRKQRFHVRRGQLKKEVRSQRWRKLFKTSFKATVERCEKLRRQGW